MFEVSKTISHTIRDQFPDLYRVEGETLVALMEAFYEFLENESGQNVKLSREILDNNDIDTAAEEFVVHFQEKFLNGLPLDLFSDKRFIIKHIMDFYRTKGSEKSLQLLLKLLYGQESEIYLPSKNIFRSSDSKWVEPIYLELSHSPKIKDMVSKQIVGTISGATAFVEGIIKKREQGRFIFVAYLSSVSGTFTRGENVLHDGVVEDSPMVLGSLSDIEITNGGKNFRVGDILDVVADYGVQGKVRVAETYDATGRVDFTIRYGGWGYTANTGNPKTESSVYVADASIYYDNTPNFNFELYEFESVKQQIETLTLLSATDINTNANVGDRIVGVDSSGNEVASGNIVSVANTDSSGYTILSPSANSIVKIDVDPGKTFTLQNKISVHANTHFSDGEKLHQESDVSFDFTNLVGSGFVVGERVDQYIYEPVNNNIVGHSFGIVTSANSSHLALTEAFGDFRDGYTVIGQTSGSEASPVNIVIDVEGASANLEEIDANNDLIVTNINGDFTTSKKIWGERTNMVDVIDGVVNSGASLVWLEGNPNANGIIDTITDETNRGIVVGSNSVVVGVYGNNSPFYPDEYGNFRLVTERKSTMISPPTFTKTYPTHNVIPHVVVDKNEIIGDLSTISNKDAMFEVSFALPQNLVNGTVFEVGGDTFGTFLGVVDSVVNPGQKALRFATGNAAATVTTTDAIVLDIEEDQLPTDNNVHEYTIVLDQSVARVDLYIDHEIVAFANTSGVNAFTDWTDSGFGGFGYIQDTVIAAGNTSPSNLWDDANLSQLKIYDSAPNTDAIPGNVIELEYRILDLGTGQGADFDIGYIEDTETVSIYSDFLSDNNVADIPFMEIRLDGSGSSLGHVDGVTIDSGGSGYANGQIVTFTGGGYSGGNPILEASGYITTDSIGAITSITMSNNGIGYYETPDIDLGTTTGTVASVTVDMVFSYGFPKLPGGTLDDPIDDLLDTETVTLGEIASLTNINPGQDYNLDPMVAVNNKLISTYDRRDFVITINNITGSYAIGETIIQRIGSTVTEKGRVWNYEVNDDGTAYLYLERRNFGVGFDESVQLEGNTSGATSNIVAINSDVTRNPIGVNADIYGRASDASGVVSRVDVINSGYGYYNGQNANLESPESPYVVFGVTVSNTQGKGQGFWDDENSHIDLDKRIHDNDYYQEYSYDVITGISLNRYEKYLKDMLHVAGTKMFGTVSRVTKSSNIIDVADSSIEIA